MTDAFHVEAKLHAFRKTQDGVVVSFTVSPIDLPQQLALDPLGTRYMLALAAIGDDEQPLARKEVVPADTQSERQIDTQPPVAIAPPGAKSRYASATPQEQAVMRAGMLAQDRTFQRWINARDEDDAAYEIRVQCGVQSRRDIASDEDAYRAFLALERRYQEDTGLVAEMR